MTPLWGTKTATMTRALTAYELPRLILRLEIDLEAISGYGADVSQALWVVDNIGDDEACQVITTSEISTMIRWR